MKLPKLAVMAGCGSIDELVHDIIALFQKNSRILSTEYRCKILKLKSRIGLWNFVQGEKGILNLQIIIAAFNF